MLKFHPISEASITRAISEDFFSWFKEYVVSDCIIVGAGPSGLMAAYDLARRQVKTLVIESNNYAGGGFWIGGYFMNTLTFRAPAQEILEELNIAHRQVTEGLFVADGPSACSKLISAACEAGARILSMTRVDDCIYRQNKVEGVVVNWTAVAGLPRAITCVDPVALEAKVVIDATGHDAYVCQSLAKRKILEFDQCAPMDVNVSEDLVVEKTSEIFPGLLVCGMSVATVFGLPRMGPTFGAMLFSGRKAATLTMDILSKTSQFAPA